MLILLFNSGTKETKLVQDITELVPSLLQNYSIPQKEDYVHIIQTDYKIKQALEILNKEDIRKYISLNIKELPLYDIAENKIAFIPEGDIYHNVMHNHLRFPEKDIVNGETKHISALDNFDTYILKDRYKTAIYNSVTDGITICRDTSMLRKKTDPYFSRDKLIKLALNYNIIKSPTEIEGLCDLIHQNVITEMAILKHAEYIRTAKERYIIRFYSMDGDYYINKYLRNLSGRQHKNVFLEKLISLLWNLIRKSPPLKRDHIVFRFIDSDLHLEHLNINDKYPVKGFMSTTRNPFYENDEYAFGDIVMKIHLPAKMQGIALLMELQSDFEDEQEVLIAPLTTLQLVAKNIKFYHTNKSIENKIRKTYEFKVIKTSPPKYPEIYVEPTATPTLVFKQIMLEGNNLQDRIDNFKSNYISSIQQFNTVINGKKYLFYIRIYDSDGVYAEHYHYKTNNGFSINYQNVETGQKCMMIEIDQDGIAVNYGIEDTNCYNIPNANFYTFLSELAIMFKINKVLLFSNKVSCSRLDDLNKLTLFERYNVEIEYFNIDIYNYFKHNKLRYPELDNNINKMKLNKFETIPIPKTYQKTELYKTYPGNNNMKDFYIFLVETDCKNIAGHHEKISKELDIKNLFKEITYTLIPTDYVKKF